MAKSKNLLPDPSQDSEGVEELEKRIATAAISGSGTITYSELIDGVNFRRPDGRPYRINRENASDRELLGRYLGVIVSRSWSAHGFMASAVVVQSTNGQPSDGFYKLAYRERYLPEGKRAHRFWQDQLKLAREHYQQQAETENMPTLAELNEYLRTFIVREGKKGTQTVTVRERCETATLRAREHYQKNGVLRCEVCEWEKPEQGFSGTIIEMHHRDVLADSPEEGRRLTLAEAIERLAPLCPNCHRLAHARPDGDIYSAEELKQLLRR